MVLAKIDICKMCKELQYSFLYENNIDSIYILLNIYDLEDNMTNIYPKYISTSAIRKRVKRQLIYKKDREFISNNIALLLHEDVDRLELILYLEGYKNGYQNIKWANILEEKTIKCFSIEQMYEKNFLFHHDTVFKEIKKFKEDFKNQAKIEEKETKFLNDFINRYCEKVIKRKIYTLNIHIDKQLAMEFDSNKMNIKEEPLLTTDELNKMYKIIVDTIIRNIVKIYIEANWLGVNDRVGNRYL